MNDILAALLNGVVLSALLTALVWLAFRVTPRRILSASSRYVLWWATLAVSISLSVWYLVVTAPPTHEATTEAANLVQPPRSVVASVVGQTPWSARDALVPLFAQLEGSDRAIEKVSDNKNETKSSSRQPARDSHFRHPTTESPLPSVTPHATVFPRTVEIANPVWPRLIVGAWLFASFVLLCRLAISCALLARTSRRAFEVSSSLRTQSQHWLSLCRATRRGVRVAISSEIATPVAVGPRRPSILIPVALLSELTERELQQIGLHEAGHLARFDDYALILQRVIESLLVFHPVVRWITRQIDLEREIACDDLVIAAIGHPRSYASCLTRVVELSVGVRSPLTAAGAADDTSHLSRRVDMLLDKTRQVSTHLPRTRLAAMVTLLSTLGWVAGHVPVIVAFASPLARPIHKIATVTPPLLPHVTEEPQAKSPDFEGRVIEDFSGNPMASAELRFRQAGMRELAADLDTDREGRAQISGLASGEYTLEVAKPNYVTTSLKVHVPTTGLVVRLVRHAAISGRVIDQQGEPVPARIHAPYGRTIGGTRVVALVKANGSDELRPAREISVEPDGTYRFHDLTPGEYAVGIWYDGLKDGSGFQLFPDNVHPRYFPISGGEEVSNINFQIQPSAAYQVSGKIELPHPKDEFSLALGLANQPALPIAQALTEEDGSFRFPKVPAGTYELYVGGPSRGYGPHDTVLGPQATYARTQISVGGQNVDGLNIAVSPGKPIEVVLHAHNAPKESAQPPAGCPQTATVIAIPLEPWGLLFQGNLQASFGKSQPLENLPPGKFRIEAVGLPPGCYQVGHSFADLSRDPAGPVTVELASSGSLRGVLHAGAASSSDFSVILLDATTGVDAEAQVVVPDTQGHFAFQGLRPGRYRIAAQLSTDTVRSRWVRDISRMLEVEVAGGAPTDLDLPVTPKEARQ